MTEIPLGGREITVDAHFIWKWAQAKLILRLEVSEQLHPAFGFGGAGYPQVRSSARGLRPVKIKKPPGLSPEAFRGVAQSLDFADVLGL